MKNKAEPIEIMEISMVLMLGILIVSGMIADDQRASKIYDTKCSHGECVVVDYQ